MKYTRTLFAALLLEPLATLHAASGFQVSDLKTDYRQNPLGLEARHLRFSWRVSESDQAAWQVQAFVNGSPVDDTLLGPPQSDYEEWAFYTTQDINPHFPRPSVRPPALSTAFLRRCRAQSMQSSVSLSVVESMAKMSRFSRFMYSAFSVTNPMGTDPAAFFRLKRQ